MSVLDNETKRRLRGVILKLVYENHEKQRHRLDDLTLHGVLERLHYDLSRNEVRTLVQDLGERDCLKCIEERDKDSGKVSLRQIQILPRGRDLIEKSETDAGVEVE